MKDPEEKENQAQSVNEENNDQQSNDKNANWDKHQQIDEEGNEVGPDDIK